MQTYPDGIDVQRMIHWFVCSYLPATEKSQFSIIVVDGQFSTPISMHCVQKVKRGAYFD